MMSFLCLGHKSEVLGLELESQLSQTLGLGLVSYVLS